MYMLCLCVYLMCNVDRVLVDSDLVVARRLSNSMFYLYPFDLLVGFVIFVFV